MEGEGKKRKEKEERNNTKAKKGAVGSGERFRASVEMAGGQGLGKGA